MAERLPVAVENPAAGVERLTCPVFVYYRCSIGGGIAKNGKGTKLVQFEARADDITVEDLGGRRVAIATISTADQKMLLDFLVMADKAAAHFTSPYPHDRT